MNWRCWLLGHFWIGGNPTTWWYHVYCARCLEHREVRRSPYPPRDDEEVA